MGIGQASENFDNSGGYLDGRELASVILDLWTEVDGLNQLTLNLTK